MVKNTLQVPHPSQRSSAWDNHAGSSVVPPPKRARFQKDQPLKFSREATEAFLTYRESGISERTGDNLLAWASHPKYRGSKLGFSRIRTLSKQAVKVYPPSGVQSANFTWKQDVAQKLIFHYRDLYDEAKELLKKPKLSGKQYTEAEIAINVECLSEFSAFNTGRAFEAAQVFCEEGVSPISIFLSSDATLIGKRGGAHPIISEFYTSWCTYYVLIMYVSCMCYVCVMYLLCTIYPSW